MLSSGSEAGNWDSGNSLGCNNIQVLKVPSRIVDRKRTYKNSELRWGKLCSHIVEHDAPSEWPLEWHWLSEKLRGRGKTQGFGPSQRLNGTNCPSEKASER